MPTTAARCRWMSWWRCVLAAALAAVLLCWWSGRPDHTPSQPCAGQGRARPSRATVRAPTAACGVTPPPPALQVFTRERDAKTKAQRMWKLSLVLGGLLLLMLAANAGLVRGWGPGARRWRGVRHY